MNGSDDVVQLWSTKDGSLLKICSREGKDGMDSLHGGWLSDLHFSKDNSLLVSTGGYVKVCQHFVDNAFYFDTNLYEEGLQFA